MQPFIIMTDYAEVNTAVESMKLGSIDYIPKQLVEDKLVICKNIKNIFSFLQNLQEIYLSLSIILCQNLLVVHNE